MGLLEVASPTVTLPQGQLVASPPSVAPGSATASRRDRLRPSGFSTARSLTAAWQCRTPQPHRPGTNEARGLGTSAAPVPLRRQAGPAIFCVGQKGESHPRCYHGDRRAKDDLKADKLWAGCYLFLEGLRWLCCLPGKVVRAEKWRSFLRWSLL